MSRAPARRGGARRASTKPRRSASSANPCVAITAGVSAPSVATIRSPSNSNQRRPMASVITVESPASALRMPAIP
jgi:hypothetical protein